MKRKISNLFLFKCCRWY